MNLNAFVNVADEKIHTYIAFKASITQFTAIVIKGARFKQIKARF